MSILAGVYRPEGNAVEEHELMSLSGATDRYAPDGTFVRASGRVGMVFQPFCTHERSRLESRPVADLDGNMLTFDGRLDNHSELRQQLNIVAVHTADSVIVLKAFARWGEHCFRRLVGDWSLALWSHSEHSLYLVRDHAGTRTLYFEQREGTLRWSTYLEPLVSNRKHSLDDDYVACYLACQPLRNLTPYQGITAVPPAHYLVFRGGEPKRLAHWNWMQRERLHYKNPNDYDEHFVSLFRQSVERRTGDGTPILAELSGGVDSSSIVCMSDYLRRTNKSGTEALLDTLSYYDDTEPNWNEKPIFTAVEAKRGKSGIHIDTAGFGRVFEPAPRGYLQPGKDNNSSLQDDSLHKLLDGKGFRVILSGMGGDELLGGVPAAHPELADHLVAGRFRTLLARGVDWSLPNRTPLLHLLFSTAKYCIDCYRPPALEWDRIPPWLPSSLTSRCHRLETNAIERIPTIGFRPSAVENGQTWWHIMETLPHLFQGFFHRPEYRYPYLDRDLVEFLQRVPRQELAQPGRRRAMMRRALRNIVPPEVLERRRKGFLIRKRLVSMRANKSAFDRLLADSIVLGRFSIDKGRLLWALDQTLQGQDIRWWPAIDRLVLLELWLRSRGDF